MERLVVGFDGSPAAEAALDWVTERALRGGRVVDIVTVGSALTHEARWGATLAEDAAERLRQRVPGLVAEGHALDGGTTAALLDAALTADLLVIGVDRARTGSTLHGLLPGRLASEASSALCLVPIDREPGDDAVVAGVGPDLSSEAALAFAAEEAAATEQRLRLVHAWTPPGLLEQATLASDPVEAAAEHRNVLANAARDVRSAHGHLDVVATLRQSSAADALMAEAVGASIVVVGTHRRGLLASAMHGSVVSRLVGRLPAPLCVVPARELQDRSPRA